MFNKIKHLQDLRKQAKHLQDELALEIVEHTNSGVSIKMNGNQEILSFTITEELAKSGNKTKIEQAVKIAFEEILKKLQRKMAEKMMKGKSINDIQIPGF